MQQFIPGTEPPNRDPEIDRAIEDKYKRLAALKIAREAVAVSDAKLLELIEERGAPYAFTEPGTGKRRTLRLDAKKRLKSERAKSAKKEQADAEWEATQAEHRGGDQQAAGEEQWAQEIKRRRGQSVEDDTRAELDPFAATRAAMNGEAADRGGATPRAKRASTR